MGRASFDIILREQTLLAIAHKVKCHNEANVLYLGTLSVLEDEFETLLIM